MMEGRVDLGGRRIGWIEIGECWLDEIGFQPWMNSCIIDDRMPSYSRSQVKLDNWRPSYAIMFYRATDVHSSIRYFQI